VVALVHAEALNVYVSAFKKEIVISATLADFLMRERLDLVVHHMAEDPTEDLMDKEWGLIKEVKCMVVAKDREATAVALHSPGFHHIKVKELQGMDSLQMEVFRKKPDPARVSQQRACMDTREAEVTYIRVQAGMDSKDWVAVDTANSMVVRVQIPRQLH